MINYLVKFNNLPPVLRDNISSPAVMEAISEIEKKYNINLATVIIKIMVKEILMDDLVKYFVFEDKLGEKQAEELVGELKERVFYSVADYLVFSRVASANKQPVIGETKKLMPMESKEPIDRWMQKKKKETAVHSSSFFFSPEDEEEVRELSKKVEDFTKSEEPASIAAVPIEKQVENIMSDGNINFSSEELGKRFKQVLTTYLKGVRNRIDVKQTLIRSIEVGGLGMEVGLADKILVKADNIKKTQEERKGVAQTSKITTPKEHPTSPISTEATPQGQVAKQKVVGDSRSDNDVGSGTDSMKQSGIRDIDYDFSKLSAMPKGAVKTPGGDKVEINAQKEIKEALNKDSTGLLQVVNVEREKSGQVAKDVLIGRKIPDISNNINIRRPASTMDTPAPVGKKKMEDVKYVPKLTGPVDELRETDIVNLRRLSNDPESALAKIKRKINFLGEENYSQLLAGIKAWRQSPVNKLYLELGQESINQKKPVNDIIEERRTTGKEFLTKQEFAAIMDLNRELRF